MEQKRQDFSIWYFVTALLVLLVLQTFLLSPPVEWLTYSQFKSLVKAGLVTDLVVEAGTIRGKIKAEGVKQFFLQAKLEQLQYDGKSPYPFSTVRVDDPGLTAELEAAGIAFRGELTSEWLPAVLSWAVPVALFFALWVFLMKRMGAGGGLMQNGKSKAKVFIEKKTGVSFTDVEGIMVFGDVSTGAQNDLQKATEIARTMVTQFGMSEKIGLVALEGPRAPLFLPVHTPLPKEYSDETARAIDAKVKTLLSESHAKVSEILSSHRQTLHELAKLLLEKEMLERPELQAILKVRSLDRAKQKKSNDAASSRSAGKLNEQAESREHEGYPTASSGGATERR